MIINLWVLAVLVELVLLASVGLVWALRTRVVLVTAPPPDEGSVRPPTAPPSPPPKPKTPVPEEGPRRSFWEASQAALAEGSTALSVPDVPAPPPIEEPKLVALEPQVVLQAMPIYLEESDVEAALASAGAGFGADDLMQLQDVVSSTEAKLKREAKALDGLVKRLTAEAEQLTAAAAVLTPLLGGELAEDVRASLAKAAPALGTAETAIKECTHGQGPVELHVAGVEAARALGRGPQRAHPRQVRARLRLTTPRGPGRGGDLTG